MFTMSASEYMDYYYGIDDQAVHQANGQPWFHAIIRMFDTPDIICTRSDRPQRGCQCKLEETLHDIWFEQCLELDRIPW